MDRVLQEAYTAGARIHSNSWIQVKSRHFYTRTAEEIDRFMFEHRDMIVVVAVGNEGRFGRPGEPELGTIRSPGVAKNCIAVGASESHRPEQSRAYRDFFPDRIHKSIGQAILADEWADGPEVVTPFSGRGPTADGRIKPDLVAPGTAILSARSRRANVRSVWGAGSDPDFVFLGGTSSAAPLVAGCAAVVRQFAQDSLGESAPSSALVKALLLNGTDSLSNRTVPDPAQGWGRVNLAASVVPAREFAPVVCVRAVDEGRALVNNERARFRIHSEAAGPLRVSLAWTEPPGEGLLSDLDLIVELPTMGELHGNRSPGDASFDGTNNVEHVRIDNCPAGEVRISVVATQLREGPQTFALVVLGAFGTQRLTAI